LSAGKFAGGDEMFPPVFCIEKTTGWASGSKELIAMRKKGIEARDRRRTTIASKAEKTLDEKYDTVSKVIPKV